MPAGVGGKSVLIFPHGEKIQPGLPQGGREKRKKELLREKEGLMIRGEGKAVSSSRERGGSRGKGNRRSFRRTLGRLKEKGPGSG